MGKIIFAAMVAMVLMGCGSLQVHTNGFMSCSVGEPRIKSPSPIFGGVVFDIFEIGDGVSDPITQKHDYQWYEVVCSPLIIIDVPFSLVVDICYLPSDICFWPTWSSYSYRRELDNQSNRKADSHKTNAPADAHCKPVEPQPNNSP